MKGFRKSAGRASRGERRTEHGGKQDYGSEEDMSLEIKRLMREEILFNDLEKREPSESIRWRKLVFVPLCTQRVPVEE